MGIQPCIDLPARNVMGRVTVVIVDDDIPIIQAYKLCFEHLVDLHTAYDGQSALDLIESGIRPDVLVCDYRLPDINGVEVVRRARRIMGDNVPAIIASGDTSAQTIEEAGLAHCEMLKKPYTPDALVKLIARINLDRAQCIYE
jgi:two-component system CheB/CheR fusion protein